MLDTYALTLFANFNYMVAEGDGLSESVYEWQNNLIEFPLHKWVHKCISAWCLGVIWDAVYAYDFDDISTLTHYQL